MNGRVGEKYDEAILDNCVLKKELIITPAEIEKVVNNAKEFLDVGFDYSAMESRVIDK